MDLIEFLQSYEADPLTYLLLFFLFSVATTVFLPIPVEILLPFNPSIFFPIKATVLGSGKAVGAFFIFLIGVKIEKTIRSWTRWRWFNWLVRQSERVVKRFGYLGLYILISIPGMPDTIPLYIFSIFNREGGTFTKEGFALTSFLGGVNRAFIIYFLLEVFGIGLF